MFKYPYPQFFFSFCFGLNKLFHFLLFWQIYALLCGIDERLIRKDIPMFDSLPLTSFPVTPNGHRVSEMVNQFTGARLVFVSR